MKKIRNLLLGEMAFLPRWLWIQVWFAFWLVVLGTGIFFLGVFGILSQPFLNLLLGFWVVGCVFSLTLPKFPGSAQRPPKGFSGPEKVLGITAFGIATLTLLHGLLPPTARDGLIHHLALPKIYWQNKHFVNLPFAEQAFNPMLVDMLNILPIAFSMDFLSHSLHAIFGFLTALMIYQFSQQILPRHYALLGLLAFIGHPLVFRMGTSAYVDLSITYFSTLGFVLFFFAFERKVKDSIIGLAGFAFGAAMATKYNGFLLHALANILLILVCLRRKTPVLKRLFIFNVMAIMVVSPWLIRNYVWSGNPIYPFFRSVIGFMPLPAEANPSVPPLVHRVLIYQESFVEILLIPLRLFFTGKEQNPQQFDGSLTPLLVIFSPLLCLAFKKNRGLILSSLFVVLFYALYVCFFRILRVRYLLPIVPFLVLFSLMGLSYVKNIRWRRLGEALLVGLMFLNLISILKRHNHGEVWRIISNQFDRDQYLGRVLPEYPVQKFANANLKKTDKILFVYLGLRGYYCDIPYIYDFHDDLRTFRRWLSHAKTPNDLLMSANREGITHMMFHKGFLEKSLRFDFDTTKYDVALLRLFLETNQPLYQNGPIALVAIP